MLADTIRSIITFQKTNSRVPKAAKYLPSAAIYKLWPPPWLFLLIVALLLMLAIQTESSNISLTCAGLTELPR